MSVLWELSTLKKANKRFTELSKNEETWISRDLKEPNNLPQIYYKMMHLWNHC